MPVHKCPFIHALPSARQKCRVPLLLPLTGGAAFIPSYERTVHHMNELTQKARLSIYSRDGFRCAICDNPRGLQIHHCIHRSAGGSNTPMNLICLCWRCHAVAHGTRLAEYPDYLSPQEMNQAIVEYLADMYAPDWFPWDDKPL